MNYFDTIFFAKYLREGENLLFVCHKHVVLIIDDIIVLLVLGLLLPTFFYYNDSFALQNILPFEYFEIYAITLYCYLMYRIFDWYNDVWLITEEGVIDIDWDIYTRKIEYIEYPDIIGAEISTNSFFDSFLKKGNLILHTHGEGWEFMLEWATNPYEMVSYINEVIEGIHHHTQEEEKAPFELLLHTLTEMVREHLEWDSGGDSHGHGHGHKKWHGHWTHGIDKYWNEHADDSWSEEEKELEELLHRKGTIDLR